MSASSDSALGFCQHQTWNTGHIGKALSFADFVIPQADHDFEAFFLSGREYGTRHTTGLVLECCIDLSICSDNGELLGVRVKLFQWCSRWVWR